MATLGIARKFTDVVGLGGTLIDPPTNGASADFCFTEGMPMAIVGQLVAGHGLCGTPGGEIHCAAVITAGSNVVFINGVGVVRDGDPASCLDIVTTSSSVTFSD